MYSIEVLKRFRHPKYEGEIRDADTKLRVGNGICNDRLEIFIKMKDGKIKQARYLTYGCPAAVSSAELVCEKAEGKTIKQALKTSMTQIRKDLHLPEFKHHCCEMAVNALRGALKKLK